MGDEPGIDAARAVLSSAIARRVFPAAVTCVGSSRRTLWHEALGHLTLEADARPVQVDTWFDLASLTKPLVTTTIVLELVSRGIVSLDEPLSRTFRAWRGDDRAAVTVADLLEHASGLPARLPAGPLPRSRNEWIDAISTAPLAYSPRQQALYSDLGFILLAMLAEDVDGSPLDVQFERLIAALAHVHPGVNGLSFHVPAGERDRTAPTRPLPEDTRGQPLLVAEVHDNYAAALGGVAGHAGLFGTAAAVAAYAAAVLRAVRGVPEIGGAFAVPMMRRAVTRSTVPGSSRMLGWDGMLPTSSCGERMSPTAFGHVGFTGTSLWIDPARDRFFVLLTNRVCGEGTVDDMRTVRRAFHDALAEV